MPREEDEFAPVLLQLADDLDRYRPAAGGLRPDARRPGRRARRWRPRSRALAARMPTYITLKDVKKRWGHGQEDVFPVAQFEKLWGDMTALPECRLRLRRRSRARAASSSRTRPSSTAGCATARRRTSRALRLGARNHGVEGNAREQKEYG